MSAFGCKWAATGCHRALTGIWHFPISILCYRVVTRLPLLQGCDRVFFSQRPVTGKSQGFNREQILLRVKLCPVELKVWRLLSNDLFRSKNLPQLFLLSILYEKKNECYSWSSPRPVRSCFDFSTFKIHKYHSNSFEQLNVTKTKLSPILNKYWPWTEGDACLFHSVVDVLFFPSIDKHWKFPLWFLLFSSISPKSACPNQALRRLWRFCRFSKFLRTRKV